VGAVDPAGDVADGEQIRDYLDQAARKHHIDEHIELGTHVHFADWDSVTDTWTLRADREGRERVYRARFVFFATGYYDYDNPYRPAFPGIEQFTGEVVHPQHWPEPLDYAGKRIVVIGSGATAVSLIPALAERASHVTMLQRTPSYLISGPRVEPMANAVRKVLPVRVAHGALRWRNALFASLLWTVSRRAPEFTKRRLRSIAERHLPEGYAIDTHFKPPYNPWDQRLCLIVGADLYRAVRGGKVEVVTDHIGHIDAGGIALASGRHLDADVIVTATGLALQALGGVTVSVDEEKINPHDRFIYRRHMLEDVPNMAWCLGYTSASWTLGADLTAQSVAKLLRYMDSHGYTHAYPHLGRSGMPEQPAFNLQSGYVLRALDVLPKSGTRRPWIFSHDFLRDAVDHRITPIEQSMVFGRCARAGA